MHFEQSAFYFSKDLEVMVQMANATGKRADVAKYEAAVTLLRECAGVIERARGQLAVMPLPDIAPAS